MKISHGILKRNLARERKENIIEFVKENLGKTFRDKKVISREFKIIGIYNGDIPKVMLADINISLLRNVSYSEEQLLFTNTKKTTPFFHITVFEVSNILEEVI